MQIPTGESKGECGQYNDAADDDDRDGDGDVGLTNRNGARHDNNLAEWDENKKERERRETRKGEFMRLLVSFLSMPIGDVNEMDSKLCIAHARKSSNLTD